MANPRLELQRLKTQGDQVVVVAGLLQAQNHGHDFSPAEVSAEFKRLRVPAPSNPRQVIAELRKRALVTQLGGGRYALTPEGEDRAANSLSLAVRDVDAAIGDGASLGSVEHVVIPPALAPKALLDHVMSFLDRHPFERNVFGISRYPRPKCPDDPVAEALERARRVLPSYGLEFHLASDKAIADQVWPNVAASMWACRYGVVLVEDRCGEGINRNLLIEAGGMLMTGRRCVFLRDRSVDWRMTDLVGHIYEDVDLSDPASVELALRKWCENDLGLARV